MNMNNEFKRLQELAGIKENNPSEVNYNELQVGDKLRVVKEAYWYRMKLAPTRFDTDNKTRYSGKPFYLDNREERDKKDPWSSQFDSSVKIGDIYTITKVIPGKKGSIRGPQVWAETDSDENYMLSNENLEALITFGAFEYA